MKRGVLLALLFVCCVPLVEAATLHGTVYNIDLHPVQNARLDITTQPKQVFIATNGTYTLTVPEGTYVLSAALVQNGETTATAAERVTITDNGDYVLDLILFPNLEEDLLNETDINPSEAIDAPIVWPRVMIGIVIVCALLWFFLREKKKAEHKKQEKHEETRQEIPHEQIVEHAKEELHTERDDITPVVEFIKQSSGRTTQKDIRKQFPLSEAKISLIIAELEHKGMIEKIKKGRGNIILLKQ